MNFRTKISLWYAGLLILIIVVFSIAIFGVIQATITNSIDSRLAQTSTNIISNIRVIPVGEFGALENGVVFRSEDIFQVPDVSIQVWQTHNGEEAIKPILAQSSIDMIGATQALDVSTLRSDLPIFTDTNVNNMPQRIMTRPYTNVGGQQIGVIQIALPTLLIAQVIDGVTSIMIAVTVIGAIISIMLGMMVSYRALQPIQDITAAATRISTTNDLSTRLPEDVPDDEIGRLTRVFNHMMSRLDHLFSVKQRFVADLSHELRTPLTAIQGNLDMIERYGADETSLEAIRLETNRMTRMVNEVLLLARAEYGDISVDLYPVDLDSLVLESFGNVPAVAKAHHRDLQFKLGSYQSIRINGNIERLQQLIHNLMMNAIKFTQDGGTITVSIYQQDQYGVIEVKDTGIGIDKQNFDRIFDSFYQVDDSRAHMSDDDGAGLGLAIVKWIASAHGGRVQVESKLNVGTTMRVILPLLDENRQQEHVTKVTHKPSSSTSNFYMRKDVSHS